LEVKRLREFSVTPMSAPRAPGMAYYVTLGKVVGKVLALVMSSLSLNGAGGWADEVFR
jgi:hypothetical protein